MEIIPAIDLLDGNCVRLNQGDYEQVTQFNNDPLAQALNWQEQGATRLHLVDLDGARSGLPINDSSIKTITANLKIPIQIGGGIRSIERAECLLSYGIDKIIFGTIAIEKPDLIKKIAKCYPGRVVVGIDAKNNMVATRGWLTQSKVTATELAKSFEGSKIAAIISTDITTDGMLSGPNLRALREIAQITNIPIIASGGVGCLADLISLIPLKEYGVSGVIVGRALYDGAFTLEEASKVLANQHLTDPTNQKEMLT